MPAEVVVTVVRRGARASPAALVAAWLTADLELTTGACIVEPDPEQVVLTAASSRLHDTVRSLLRQRRFAGWVIEDA